MNLVKSIALALFALFTMSGCAAGLQAGPAFDTNARLEKLERENAELRARLNGRPPVAATAAAPQAMPMAYAPQVGPAAFMTPADGAPPKNLGFIAQGRIRGCSEADLVEYWNITSYPIAPKIDNLPMQLVMADSGAPFIPPGQFAVFCIDDLGKHIFSGQAYRRRGNTFKPVVGGGYQFEQNINSLDGSRHKVFVTDSILYRT